MRNLIISAILGATLVLTTSVVIANPAFPAAQMAKTQIPDLSFKEIMRKFYSGQMNRPYVDDKDITKMPHIGLRVADKDSEITVALMHPVVKYSNNALQPRYLIIIEKIKVYDNGSVVSCHACSGTADLYSFKKIANGKFQLVSRSSKKAEFSGSWGRVNLDIKEIAKNIKPLGKNLVGSTFMNSYTSTGVTEKWWEALHLPENDFIATYVIGDAGIDNANYEEDSPLYYAYDSKFTVLNNGTNYYPIKITYTGDKPSEDYERISKVNYSKIVNFDQIKKTYK